MLFPDMEMDLGLPVEAIDAYETWHPDEEEVSAASDYALDEVARSIPYGGPWHCPICQTRVPGEAVTYDEFHDERYGGCGGPVY